MTSNEYPHNRSLPARVRCVVEAINMAKRALEHAGMSLIYPAIITQEINEALAKLNLAQAAIRGEETSGQE